MRTGAIERTLNFVITRDDLPANKCDGDTIPLDLRLTIILHGNNLPRTSALNLAWTSYAVIDD